MLHEKMEKALNDQINAEFYSAYLYYSMAQYFESVNLAGAARWMRIQALEEMSHGHRLAAYVNERGGRVLAQGIEAPATSWDSPLAVFEKVYDHEVHVTSLVNKLADLSRELSDHASYNMLQWFVAEQVEEEASANGVLQQLKLSQSAPGALFMIDRELGARAFNLPADMVGSF